MNSYNFFTAITIFAYIIGIACTVQKNNFQPNAIELNKVAGCDIVVTNTAKNQLLIMPTKLCGTTTMYLLQVESVPSNFKKEVISNAVINKGSKNVTVVGANGRKVIFNLTGNNVSCSEENTTCYNGYGLASLSNTDTWNDLQEKYTNISTFEPTLEPPSSCFCVLNGGSSSECTCAGGQNATACSCSGGIATAAWGCSIECGSGSFACCTPHIADPFPNNTVSPKK